MMTVDDVEQVDAVLCEDGRSVVFYAWTADPDACFVWSVSLPMPTTEEAFLATEWRAIGWLQLKSFRDLSELSYD